MLLVTGTKRSGTSMWMQVLRAAGLPIIGDAFPSHWERSIKAANPRGFYESPLRRGVYYATNPDPKSGAFLSPGQTRDHAVKVFIPGVIRSDLAYMHRVLATLRDWRAYGPSIRRLYAMEDDWLSARPLREGETAERKAEALAKTKQARGTLPPAIEWWVENYDLVRDVTTRRYAFHLVSYDRLLGDPAAEVQKALGWLGRTVTAAELDAALGEVERRGEPRPRGGDDGIDADTAAFFDSFYEAIHTSGKLTRSMVDEMNRVHHRIVEAYSGVRRDPDAD